MNSLIKDRCFKEMTILSAECRNRVIPKACEWQRQENVLAANETAAKMEKNLQKRRRCTAGTFDFSIIFINSSCSPQH